MVCDTLVYHPTITKLIKFLDSTPKREKSFRLVAYLSRFLSYYLKRQGFSPELVKKVVDLKGHVTFLRKGMRFLKPLNHLETASKAFDNKLTDPILKNTTVLRNLGYAAYLSLDSITWFKMLGLVDKKKYPTVSTWASRFWALGLIAGIINSLRLLSINSSKLENAQRSAGSSAETEKPVDVKAIGTKIYQAKRKLVWDFLDLFIALNSLDYLHFTEGDVGLAGTITSIMGLNDQWAST